jgi:hypothetical protein
MSQPIKPVPANYAVKARQNRYTAARLMRAALLSGTAVVGLLSPASAAASKSDTYLEVWASDKETDDNHLYSDFMAIIDADRRSPHYGKVVNTAALEAVPNANLLDELGMASGIASDVLNEAHHMNHDPITVYGRRYLFPAGLMSAEHLSLRCDRPSTHFDLSAGNDFDAGQKICRDR